VLTERAISDGLPAVSIASSISASRTSLIATSSSDVVAECPPDGASVVASLRSKLVHCIDEHRHMERSHREDFGGWFERLIATTDFVMSIDQWT